MRSLDVRKLLAEGIGTASLVFFAVGVATLSFGFHFAGASTAAGVVATALAFGLVLLALVYAIGPISGAHVNPAVTLGILLSGGLSLFEAIGYWVAQFIGGLAGAFALWGVLSGSPLYSKSKVGLGADGYGSHSMVHLSAGGAFAAEAILTFFFVLVVIGATHRAANAGMAGVAIGFALALVHLIGIPLTGTSVNPARALGPAVVLGGDALSQVWLFIVAPLVGGAAAAGVFRVMVKSERGAPEAVPTEPSVAP